MPKDHMRPRELGVAFAPLSDANVVNRNCARMALAVMNRRVDADHNEIRQSQALATRPAFFCHSRAQFGKLDGDRFPVTAECKTYPVRAVKLSTLKSDNR